MPTNVREKRSPFDEDDENYKERRRMRKIK